MSLGFARDSILDLATMAKDHEELERAAEEVTREVEKNAQMPGGGGGGGGGGAQPGRSSSFEQQLLKRTPSLGSVGSNASGGGGGGMTVEEREEELPAKKGIYFHPRQSREATAAAEGGSDTDSQTSGVRAEKSTAYSAFSYGYAEYADYYAEAEAMSYGMDIGTKKGSGGLFCCLFAPWNRAIAAPEEEEGDEAEDGHDGAAAATTKVSAAATGEKKEGEGKETPPLQKLPLEPNDSLNVAKAKKLGLVKDEAPESSTDTVEATAASPVVPTRGGPEEEKKGEEDAVVEVEAASSAGAPPPAPPSGSADEEDEATTASAASGDTDVYGEKLTDKDRQAVLARLRLADPPPPPEVSTAEAGGDDAGLNVDDEPGSGSTSPTAGTRRKATKSEPGGPSKMPKRGILKRTSKMSAAQQTAASASGKAGGKSPSSGGGAGSSPTKERRSLFPAYSPKVHPEPGPGGTGGEVPKKSVVFSPMARVVSVTSRSDLTYVERSLIWWQRSDYDEFKKTGRMIAKAILEGGSSIWLASNNAWERKQQQNRQKRAESVSGDKDEGWDDEYNRALREYAGQQDAGEQPAQQEDYGNKWWCKFGHSRRGLEHIASMEEGRQRQKNVNTSIKAIIDEQRAQRLHHQKDAVKLSRVAIQYTSWARDLALAAAAADAEAVRTNFGQAAKTRAHYLRNGIGTAGEPTQAPHAPHVRKTSAAIAPEILDANTATHRYLHRKDSAEAEAKQAQAKAQAQAQLPTGAGAGPAAPAAAAPTPAVDGGEVRGVTEPEEEDAEAPPSPKKEGLEAIHDPDAMHESLSKKAAGFNQHSDDDVDMSAVLTGMGPVHKNQMSVGAH